MNETTDELRKSDIRKYSKGEIDFNPWDIEQYCNYVFKTEKSTYRLDEEETIWGRPSVDGREIEMMGGLEPRKFREIWEDMKLEKGSDYNMSRKEAIWIIRTYGGPVEEGKCLAVVMKPEEVPEGVPYIPKTPWMFTSPIKKMDPPPSIN